METLAKEFLNQECIIYTLTDTSGSVTGTIREVRDGGLLVEDRTGQRQAINLAFVTRIRAYPRNKKGKKKSIVVD